MGKHGDLVKILTIFDFISVLAIAGIASGGSLFPAAAALVLLFMFWVNDNVLEQEGCVEA